LHVRGPQHDRLCLKSPDCLEHIAVGESLDVVVVINI
jgi:hypothetical protein